MFLSNTEFAEKLICYHMYLLVIVTFHIFKCVLTIFVEMLVPPDLTSLLVSSL